MTRIFISFKRTRFLGLNWYCLVEITQCIDFYRILEKYLDFILPLAILFEGMKLNHDTFNEIKRHFQCT